MRRQVASGLGIVCVSLGALGIGGGVQGFGLACEVWVVAWGAVLIYHAIRGSA